MLQNCVISYTYTRKIGSGKGSISRKYYISRTVNDDFSVPSIVISRETVGSSRIGKLSHLHGSIKRRDFRNVGNFSLRCFLYIAIIVDIYDGRISRSLFSIVTKNRIFSRSFSQNIQISIIF